MTPRERHWDCSCEGEARRYQDGSAAISGRQRSDNRTPTGAEMKIDAFCHILPRAYAQSIEELDSATAANIRARIAGVPSLIDLPLRLRQLEEFDNYQQIISLPAPAPEDLGSPEVSRRRARVGNEGLAELVAGNPDRFVGFVAAVPLNDIEGG